MINPKFKLIIKATRANFLPASVIPFLIGALYAHRSGYKLPFLLFFLGIIATAAMHLAGNLFNDYFDHSSGADNTVRKESPFFGGSRVIQEGLLSERDILRLAIFFAAGSFILTVCISIATANLLFPVFMLAIGLLAIEYTAPPFRFAYNVLGEFIIFLLFGVFIVTGSFYLFSGHIAWRAVLVSLPIAFLVAAIIICNEIPDYHSDIMSGKYNLIYLAGYDRGYIIYAAALLFSVSSIIMNVLLKTLPTAGLLIIPLYLIGMRAIHILKKVKQADIGNFIHASQLTIMLHGLVGASFAGIYLIKL